MWEWKGYVRKISSFINRRKEFFGHHRNGSKINEMAFYIRPLLYHSFFFFSYSPIYTPRIPIFPSPHLRGHWNLDGFVVVGLEEKHRAAKEAIGQRCRWF